METEKQNFLLECIEESSSVSHIFAATDIPLIKVFISNQVLNGAAYIYITADYMEILGFALDRNRIRFLMSYLKDIGFQVEENPPGNIGYFKIGWN
jgi:hypothetical protein